MKAPSPDDFLPLHPLHFRILVALGEGPLHGYRIVKAVEERARGTVHPANLYRRIRDLADQGLIEETEPTEALPDRRARKFFRLTQLGRTVAAAEVSRMRDLLADVGDALPEPGA